MSDIEKILKKILEGRQISYHDAERILMRLGFQVSTNGSHHTFRKKDYALNISLKKDPNCWHINTKF